MRWFNTPLFPVKKFQEVLLARQDQTKALFLVSTAVEVERLFFVCWRSVKSLNTYSLVLLSCTVKRASHSMDHYYNDTSFLINYVNLFSFSQMSYFRLKGQRKVLPYQARILLLKLSYVVIFFSSSFPLGNFSVSSNKHCQCCDWNCQ